MLIPDQLVGLNVVIWNIKGSEKKKVFMFRQTSSKKEPLWSIKMQSFYMPLFTYGVGLQLLLTTEIILTSHFECNVEKELFIETFYIL